jgi:hypothetical protein
MTQIVETEQGMTHIKEHGDEYITSQTHFEAVPNTDEKGIYYTSIELPKGQILVRKDKSLELWYEKIDEIWIKVIR